MEATQIVSQHSQHSSVYQIVTDQIVRQLESGVVPWHRPWTCESPVNLISQKPYRGINPFLLAPQGYGSKYWLTFRQAVKLGGHVRKGEKSSLVTFWNIGQEKIIRDTTSGVERKSRPFLLRFYRVFNLEQIENVADKLGIGKTSPRVPSLDECENLVAGMPNPPKREQSHKAWYRPSTDTVGLPSRQAFGSPEEYYSTLFHELTHSTGHASRVGRDGIEVLNTFGSESYSKEELIAELGASMLCGVTGIAPRTTENSAAYLKTWIERLRGDSKLIVQAASAAQKAADYIRNVAQPDKTDATPDPAEGGAL